MATWPMPLNSRGWCAAAFSPPVIGLLVSETSSFDGQPQQEPRDKGRTTAIAMTTIAKDEGILARVALRFAAWAERWYPDAYIFVAASLVVVAAAAMLRGASPVIVAKAFADGFWSLIVFTLQVSMISITGYAVATSPPVLRLIERSAMLPRSGRAAVAVVAAVRTILSLLNWSVSITFSALLVRALARRTHLRMDYRAAGAAAFLGAGGTWALGLTSAAAQIQANAASLPKSLLPITGVIP